MNMFKEFKQFAVRGNVIDMGIGVVLGTAFGKIVDSLVSDVLMPPVGLLLGKVNFSNLYINLSGGYYQSLTDAQEAGAATINYGMFFNSVVHFAIVAMATFATIKQINRIRKVPFSSVTTKECPFCFSNIPSRALKCPRCTTNIIDDPKNKQAEMTVRIKAG